VINFEVKYIYTFFRWFDHIRPYNLYTSYFTKLTSCAMFQQTIFQMSRCGLPSTGDRWLSWPWPEKLGSWKSRQPSNVAARQAWPQSMHIFWAWSDCRINKNSDAISYCVTNKTWVLMGCKTFNTEMNQTGCDVSKTRALSPELKECRSYSPKQITLL